MWWKFLRKYFFTGLLVLLPLIITIYILVFAFNFIDSILKDLILLLFGRHIPGLGFLLVIALIFLAGLFGTNVVGKKLISLGERILQHIPFVKSIYTAIKQVIETFSPQQASFQGVVMLEFPRRGLYSIGFVTGDSTEEVRLQAQKNLINVYLPGTPPTAGVFVMVPREEVRFLNISVEDALKLLVSGGIVGSGS